jgi:hypothetical protein
MQSTDLDSAVLESGLPDQDDGPVGNVLELGSTTTIEDDYSCRTD